MGVPRFYRWLSERYPRINQSIDANVALLPEFDNMYLDANGIIHNATHPGDSVTSSRLTMEEMVQNVGSLISHMVSIIRPRKVLFVAIDGCAPRAKMNQQRVRRFAAARDAELQREEALRRGELTAEEAGSLFDSNVITPGTAFMAQMSLHLEFFLRKKLVEDPLWAGLEIIYSGHDVPGEGEHKIQDYIRHSRSQPGYDPNTRHCLSGLDADLIMLGLSTHETHFSLLREEVDFTAFKKKLESENATKTVRQQVSPTKWQLLHLSTLRDYLLIEFGWRESQGGLKFDLERVVDDIVLLIMLVGNDFLPHLPSLDVHEGALDTVFALYKELLPEMGGYLTEKGAIQWGRVQLILEELGEQEEEVLTKREIAAEATRKRNLKYGRGRALASSAVTGRGGPSLDPFSGKNVEETILGSVKNVLDLPSSDSDDEDDEEDDDEEEGEETKRLKAELELQARKHSHLAPSPGAFRTTPRKVAYYSTKFGLDPVARPEECDNVVGDLVQRYIEGMTWVYKYYTQGIPSWIWFFPYHFAPMASDFRDLERRAQRIVLEYGQPFLPFTQLLGCLPGRSAHALPEAYRTLMTSPASPLRDFYPQTWDVDENGKANPWEFVNLLPFIDEARLRAAVAQHCPETQLTPGERARNQYGVIHVYKRDASCTEPLISPDEKLFKSRARAETSKSVYALPAIPADFAYSGVTLPGAGQRPGDPAMLSNPTLDLANSSLSKVELNTFGRPSNKLTLVLRLSAERDARLGDALKVVAHLPTSTEGDASPFVWINYPYLHRAAVDAVRDGKQLVERSKTSATAWSSPRLLSSTELEKHGDAWRAACHASLRGINVVGTGGVELKSLSSVMLLVRPLSGTKEDPLTGERVPTYVDAKHAVWVPALCCALDNPLPDVRFEPRGALPLSIRYPAGTTIMCVGEKGYGMVGRVVQTDKEALTVTAKFPASLAKHHDFGHVIAASVVDDYFALPEMARGVQTQLAELVKLQLTISPVVLDKVLGSIPVVLKSGGRSGAYGNKRVVKELGLNLRVGAHQVLPHYARVASKVSDLSKAAWADSTQTLVRVTGFTDPSAEADAANDLGTTNNVRGETFEYTPEAARLVFLYAKKFPKLFEALEKHKSKIEYTLEDLFGKSSPETALEETLKWLSQLPTYSMPLAHASSKYLSKDAIVAIQTAAEQVAKAQAESLETQELVDVALSAHLVVKPPMDAKAGDGGGRFVEPSPTSSVPPSLGDRVVNLGSASVPFGASGTVVATHVTKKTVEVVFDAPFVEGTSLRGLCKERHGKLMAWSELLNLSKRKPVPATRAAATTTASTPSKHYTVHLEEHRVAREAKAKEALARMMSASALVGGVKAPPASPLVPQAPQHQATTWRAKVLHEEEEDEEDEDEIVSSKMSSYFHTSLTVTSTTTKAVVAQQPARVPASTPVTTTTKSKPTKQAPHQQAPLVVKAIAKPDRTIAPAALPAAAIPVVPAPPVVLLPVDVAPVAPAVVVAPVAAAATPEPASKARLNDIFKRAARTEGREFHVSNLGGSPAPVAPPPAGLMGQLYPGMPQQMSPASWPMQPQPPRFQPPPQPAPKPNSQQASR